MHSATIINQLITSAKKMLMLFYHLQTIVELKHRVDLSLHSTSTLQVHANSNIKHRLLIIRYICGELDWNQATMTLRPLKKTPALLHTSLAGADQ